MEDDDFFGDSREEEQARRHIVGVEIEVKKEQIDNLGYREGLVGSLERA